jgi:peptidylprolyl isomerase
MASEADSDGPPSHQDHFKPHVGGWGWAIFFFTWLGGLIGYFSLKDSDPRRANHVMKWGLIVTLIYLIVGAGATVALGVAVGHSTTSTLSSSNTSRNEGFPGATVPPAAVTSTTSAPLSSAGKPCVAVKDPLPAGAPAVPVKVGPPPTVLVTTDLKPGTGAVVKAGQTLTVDYIGVACSTGKIFDSSYSRKQPATFPLGQVIQGWQQGLPGMKVGGERLLAIPPAQAYGTTGSPPDIAPDETLWFVVHVRSAR